MQVLLSPWLGASLPLSLLVTMTSPDGASLPPSPVFLLPPLHPFADKAATPSIVETTIALLNHCMISAS